ncbi:26S proteasome regulatory subunit RPN13 [Galdieria sulphuraria]|uniref:Adhesion regulating molecule family n=1 Tax=Galdieria sulphuraria TaxID=130081 RepID=M2W0F4_GALSU|nr:adhesion regulating molecule family [Galdieria sulphuraria]EME29091.1 adhesion regulating molecule family [Galdieria sulphuraria]GJD12707.1 26S proteasome regulatory subunit RPN13 [Galdieria sulphuraria]|eukprot:XP_005705611.1 adhesion regulating molecule family [Galdieria sulphuraria]
MEEVGEKKKKKTGNHNSILFQVAMGTAQLQNKRIISEPRKGTLLLCWISDELHLQWKNRETGVIEQDLKLSSDALFQRVEGVQDGNIYVLKDCSKTNKYFYWLQERPTIEKDGDYYAFQIQQLIDANTSEKRDSNKSDSSLSNEYSAVAANSLETVLQSLRQFRPPVTDLNQVLSAERIVPIVSDPNLEQSIHSLYEYLPKDDQNREGLIQVLSSPSFREQVHILNAGLRSPYAPQLLYSLGFPDAVNNGPDYVKAFIRAIIQDKNLDHEKKQRGNG